MGALSTARPSHAEARVVAIGLSVAVVAVVIQTGIHLANTALFDIGRLDVNVEGGAFTWLSVAAILAAAIAAGCAAFTTARRPYAFALCAAFFALFALDEGLAIHERVVWHVSGGLGISLDWDSVLWPVLYLPLFITVAVALLLAVKELSPGPRRIALLGLALLVSAVAVEAVGAPWSTTATAGSWTTSIFGAVEEGCEVGGWLLLGTAFSASAAGGWSRVPMRAGMSLAAFRK